MPATDSSNPYESPAEEPVATPQQPIIHLLTICSILCSVAGVPWTLAVTLGHDRTLRALQLIFIAVGAAGFILGTVAIYKRLACRRFDRLLAITSSFVSFTVLTVAILVPWLDRIERAYVQWTRQ